MASSINVQANEAAGIQQAALLANVGINSFKRGRTLTSSPIPANNKQTNNQEKLLKDCKDVESINGKFSYKLIEGFGVPYIIRVINGEHLKFVSVRMAERMLLRYYLQNLHADIYTCISVESHFITDSEAKLLNDINQTHNDCLYGKEMFIAGKDNIVCLEEVHKYYIFMKVCYEKLLDTNTAVHKEKCGFICINNSVSVVPYCVESNEIYAPLFYFEGTENLRHQGIKLENWNLAYLKFVFLVQGTKRELFACDSCTVISLDIIKNHYPPETTFDYYWTNEEHNSGLLINQNSFTHVNPPGAWIRAPFEEVIPQSIPVITNTYQNGMTANETGFEGSSLINDADHVVLPPPVVRTVNCAPVIGTASNSSVVPISQCMTTMNNPMTNRNVKSHSNQMQQLYPLHFNNGQSQQQHLQLQRIQQQPQIITTPQNQQAHSGQSVHGLITNTQQRSALRNIGLIVIAPATEIIDLTSPPTSPVPPTVQENSLLPNVSWEFEYTRIPEWTRVSDTSNKTAYRILKAKLQGKMIHCINAKPYVYSEWMVTLADLVQVVLPLCTVEKCAYVLQKCLKIKLFLGNTEQMAVLRKNGSLISMNQENTPMAMLQDIEHVLLQLMTLVSKQDGQVQQCQSVGGSSKRRRICRPNQGAGSSSSSSSSSSSGGGSTFIPRYYRTTANSNDFLNDAAGPSQSPHPHHPHTN